MPAYKKKPSVRAKKRDFWGDAETGKTFERLFDRKFGTWFGSRKAGLAALKLDRRIFNMYLTGERSIPDDLWASLKRFPDFEAATVAKQPKKQLTVNVVGRISTPKPLYIDDVDPLS